MERTYRILHKVLQITGEDKIVLPRSFERFRCSGAETADIVFLVDHEEEQTGCYGIGYLSGGGKKISSVFFSRKDRGQMLYSYEDDGDRWHLHLDSRCTEEILAELLMVGFYSCAAREETLLLHASAVCWREKTIIFTAASGVGKTTQAALWQQYRNASILNGDKVFLTKEEDRILAWGSPWMGSSSYAENMGAEAAAIVVLEQAAENSIRKLSGMEILEKLLPHIFFPNWDVQCEKAVLECLNTVLDRTDVYLLRCRPEEDAVVLVEKTVF